MVFIFRKVRDVIQTGADNSKGQDYTSGAPESCISFEIEANWGLD